MPIVGGLDIHRKQITFDYLDTVTGQVQRGQVSPADREHLRAWLARFAGCEDAAFAVGGVHRVAVCRRGAGRGRDHGASGRARRHRVRPRPQAARQDRQDRLPAPADAAGRGPAAGVLDPARPHPGMPGAAGDLSRPAGRAHRLGAAHPRGVVPPGRPGPGRGRAAHRAGPGRAAGGRGRAPVPGRAAAGRHRPGHARGPGGPAGRAAASAAGRGPAPDRREGRWPRGCTGSGRSPRWR